MVEFTRRYRHAQHFQHRAHVVDRIGQVDALAAADAVQEFGGIEAVATPVVAEISSEFPRQLRGEIRGLAAGEPLVQRGKDRAHRAQRIVGRTHPPAALYLAEKVIELHGFSSLSSVQNLMVGAIPVPRLFHALIATAGRLYIELIPIMPPQ